MTTISIVTPWMNGLDLLPDYAAAVQGCEVVTVDNGSDAATAQALEAGGGVYIRNETNLGFAAANNQGYAKATGDIVIFLNSDVVPAGPWLSMVAANVRDGALYGPALNHQLVWGMWLPYIEGWCIAATRGTWARLCAEQVRLEIQRFFGEEHPIHAANASIGPWDTAAYPGPYWEDNDLCLRAMQAGISLIQTAWPIQHKGGRTAGALLKHGATFECNRATFAARVKPLWEARQT